MKKGGFFIGKKGGEKRMSRSKDNEQAIAEATEGRNFQADPPKPGSWAHAFERRFGRPVPRGWSERDTAEAVQSRDLIGAT